MVDRHEAFDVTGRRTNTDGEDDDLLAPLPDKVAKTRKCLICSTPFPSAWAGERICGRCKAKTHWRDQ